MALDPHRAPRSSDLPFWLVAELEVEPVSASESRLRRSDRVEVRLGADLRRRGEGGNEVEIADLSISGFRARAHRGLKKGMDVWLRLPGLESLHARVVWADGCEAGCAFVRPLHPAVLDLVLRRAGAR